MSPFKTARDLYYDKLKIASFEDDNANWVQKEVGHLLEDLVAKIFHEKTGFRVYQIKKMFYHPVHSFMLADVDFFIELPNGKTAILEIKTTNYNAKDNWWIDGVECVPVFAYDLIPAYIESSLKTRHSRDAESAEMLDIIISNRIFDPMLIYDFSDFANFGKNNTTAIASAIDANRDKVETAIRKLADSMAG